MTNKSCYKDKRGNPLIFFYRHVFLPSLILLVLQLSFLCPAHAVTNITFDEFYGKQSIFGFEFSDKVKSLSEQKVKIVGFMAPPLKAESHFFVLTRKPLALCPFCSSDADWPEDILVIYLDEKQTFVQTNNTITVEGTLEFGSWTDPETGFVSLFRLRNARIL